MSVDVVGLWGDIAIFSDENGPAELNVRDLSRLHTKADFAPRQPVVTHNGRRYHRDTLAAPLRDFENGDLRVLDPCDFCHDGPGTEPMGDGKTACPACCSGAAGSRYDDAMEA